MPRRAWELESTISRRRFLAGAAGAAAGAALMSCTTEPAAPVVEEVPEEVPEEMPITDETYVWLGAVTAIAFWVDGLMGFNGACESLGVKGEYLGPVEYDAVAQLRILEELIAREPAGIMIFPADDMSLNDAMRRAMAAGIPVVVVNHDVAEEDARYGFVGPNNFEIGRTGGQLAVEHLGPEGKVGFVTTTSPAHGIRVSGYKDIFKDYPGIEVVAEVDGQSDPARGLAVSTDMITANPDLDMIVGIDATAGAAIARALKEIGRDGDIPVVAMDRDDDMLPYVEDGTILGTLAQNSALEEWTAVHYLYWLRHNSVPAFPDWREANAPQCPRLTDTGVTVVTKDNVEFFYH